MGEALSPVSGDILVVARIEYAIFIGKWKIVLCETEPGRPPISFRLSRMGSVVDQLLECRAAPREEPPRAF